MKSSYERIASEKYALGHRRDMEWILQQGSKYEGYIDCVHEEVLPLIEEIDRLKEGCRLALLYWYTDHPNDIAEAHQAQQYIQSLLDKKVDDE